jgi:glycosyltransferase involved in cell wall biosynthesis
MRIAMIGPFGLEPKSTVRRRALPLARALVARGDDVLVAMAPWHTPDAAPRRWQEEGVTLEYVSLGPALPLARHGAIAARLVSRALDWRPDVVHCFKPKAHAGLAGWVLWHLRRIGLARPRLVIDEDDWEGPGGWNDQEGYPPAARAVFARQERWGLCHADAVTVASRALQGIVWSLGVSPSRVHYVPNGAEPLPSGGGQAMRRRLGLGERPVLLLYTRFAEFDPERAVAVLGAVRAFVPDVTLVVVGQALAAKDDSRFDRAVQDKALGGHVVRAGWVPAAEVPDYLALADAALFPYDDTLVNRCKCSAKLIELLAAGAPVVADDVGQNREYIAHGQTGVLVPSGDVEGMAAALVSLLGDAGERGRIGMAAALRMARDYAWAALAARARGAYEG